MSELRRATLHVGGTFSKKTFHKFKKSLLKDFEHYSLNDHDLDQYLRGRSGSEMTLTKNLPDGMFDKTLSFLRKEMDKKSDINFIHYTGRGESVECGDSYVTLYLSDDHLWCVSSGLTSKRYPSKGGFDTYNFQTDWDGSILTESADIMEIRDAMVEVTKQNAPTYINDPRKQVSDYAKVMLGGEDMLAYVKDKLVKYIPPGLPILPPFKIQEN